MNKEEFAEQYGRWVKDDELIIEDLNYKDSLRVANNLANKGYRVELWKCPNQEKPHLHLKNFEFHKCPEELSNEELRKYKESFMKKYLSKKLWKIVDWNFVIAKRHRIAEEGKLHFKGYGIKELIQTFGERNRNRIERELYFKAKNVQSKEERVINPIGSGITSEIVKKVSIIELAKRYGFEVKGNKAVCKFHADSKPSLSFDDSKGLWYCFGCCQGGNIFDFLALCKKNKLKKEIQNG